MPDPDDKFGSCVWEQLDPEDLPPLDEGVRERLHARCREREFTWKRRVRDGGSMEGSGAVDRLQGDSVEER